jgi:NADPH:quinone reductase-like Zn-dependent oxidoreductase
METPTNISTMQNPSVVLYSAGKAAIEDRPIQWDLGAHEVLVRIAFVGVCGSDVMSPFFNIRIPIISITPTPNPTPHINK